MEDRFRTCPLAIVGMAARFPGVGDLDELWQVLLEARQTYGPAPDDRLDRALYLDRGPVRDDRTYTDLMGVVDGGSTERAAGLLAPEIVAAADPAHLQFFEVVLEAVEHAGIRTESLAGSTSGIWVGHASSSALLADLGVASASEAMMLRLASTDVFDGIEPGSAEAIRSAVVARLRDRYPRPNEQVHAVLQPSSAATLLARALRTQGPAMTVNAACASSLAALDLAARALHEGRVEVALVGGCSYNKWSSLVLFSRAQALSRTGSFPFDSRGDGFVSSDGHAALVVEPVSRALRLGHRVLAVIRGIGGACDGRGKSLWAPRREGQSFAIERACRGVDPETVQAIEAHATGTQVGDAVELEALAERYPRGGNSPRLPISSIKGNIGHTREAAGLAGIVKVVLAMSRGTMPPSAGYEAATSEVDWGQLRLRVVTEPEPWSVAGPWRRRAGVSSFGIGGLDFHAVIDQEADADSEPAETAPSSRETIAIVGVGAVLPGMRSAGGLEEIADACPRATAVPADRWREKVFVDSSGCPFRVPTGQGFFVSDWAFDWRNHRMPPRQAEHTDPVLLMVLDAADRALGDAGRSSMSDAQRRETAVVVGTMSISDFAGRIALGLRLPEVARDLEHELQTGGVEPGEAALRAASARKHLVDLYPVVDESGSYSSSTLASFIAKRFDLMGPCFAVDAEEASSMAALQAAVDALRAGDCDTVVCCAAQRAMDPGRFERYHRGAVLETPVREGILLGEAAVALVLRRSGDAAASGERMLAEIEHVGLACHPDGPAEALRAVSGGRQGDPVGVFGRCGFGLSERDEVSASGVTIGDDSGCADAAKRFGMAQGAAGLVSLVDAMARAGSAAEKKPAAVAVISIGLTGLGARLSLRVLPGALKSTVEERPRPRRLTLHAEDVAELAALAGTLARTPEVAWRQAARGPESTPNGGRRLTVVAGDQQSLSRRLRLASSRPGDQLNLVDQGVFFAGRRVAAHRLACVFPGQGSQYAGMFEGLPEHSAAAGRVVERADAALAGLGSPTFAALGNGGGSSDRSWAIQARVLIAGIMVFESLRELGIRPTAVVGHSFGEIPALVAADCLTLESALQLTLSRCRALELDSCTAGHLIATNVGPDLDQILASPTRSGEPVTVALRNSPQQCVLAVAEDDSDGLVEALRESNLPARRLAVPKPMHSPLLEAARQPFRSALDETEIRPPSLPWASAVDGRFHAEPDEIRDCLERHLYEPLDFCSLVGRLHRAGISAYVESGPGNTATALVREILSPYEVLTMAFDRPGVSNAESMVRARAFLEASVGDSDGSHRRAARGPLPYSRTRDRVTPSPGQASHFDATARRRATAENGPRALQPEIVPKTSAAEALDDPRARVVLELVAEQTGYPLDMLDLDLDLEADLGIDSIRKSHLFGELVERFEDEGNGGGPTDLALADMVTLRDLLTLLEDWADRPEPVPEIPSPSQTGWRRWVLRPATLPAKEDGREEATWPTAVLGDDDLAGAVTTALERAGCPVVADETDPACRRLVVVDPAIGVERLLASEAATRRQALEDAILRSFERIQAWVGSLMRRGAQEEAEVVAVTRLGGDLGIDPGRGVASSGGALAGLVKALRRELEETGVRARVVDLDPAQPPRTNAAAVISELGLADAEAEVGRVRAGRVGLKLVEIPVGGVGDGTAAALTPGSAWVVTGGGRGITAHCVRELARHHGVTLLLMGRTRRREKAREWVVLEGEDRRRLRERIEEEARAAGKVASREWSKVRDAIELEKNLAELDRIGVTWEYARLDVCDADDLGAALARWRTGHEIRGLVHGAGFEESVSFVDKDQTLVRKTFETKVLGLQHLLALTESDPVGAVIVFGSVSGRFGGVGQADYSSANELAAKILTEHRRRSGVPATTIHWQAWDEVGMAARPASRLHLRAMGWSFLPLSEGSKAFRREVEAGLPESEVVVMDLPERSGASAVGGWLGSSVMPAADRRSLLETTALLDGLLEEEPGEHGLHEVSEAWLDPATDPLLIDHQVGGRPLLPLVASMELAAEAALLGDPDGGPIGLQGVRVHAPLWFSNRARRRVEVRVGPADNGMRQARLCADVLADDGQVIEVSRTIVSATVQTVGSSSRSPWSPSLPVADDWIEVTSGVVGDGESPLFQFGPRLRTVRRFVVQGDRVWAELKTVAPEESLARHPDGPSWRLPAPVLDGCFFACGAHAYCEHGVVTLPGGLDNVTVLRRPEPGSVCTFEARFGGVTGSVWTYDFVVVDDAGVEVLWATGFRAVTVEPGVLLRSEKHAAGGGADD